jgi:hypothetical protein
MIELSILTPMPPTALLLAGSVSENNSCEFVGRVRRKDATINRSFI